MKKPVASILTDIIRRKEFGITLAMMMIHASSTEISLLGAADRIVQFILAYCILRWSFKLNVTNLPRSEAE
jgi:hypothetical protein